MIFNKNSEKKQYSTVARIETIRSGTGKAEGCKITFDLSYNFRGEQKIISVDFWNAPDLAKPQLCTRAKDLKVGDYIAVTIRNNGTSDFAVDFITENNFLVCEDGNKAYFGRIVNKQTDAVNNQPYVMLGVKDLHPKNEIAWNAFVFNESALDCEKGDLILTIGTKPLEKMSPKGVPIMTFLSDVASFEKIESTIPEEVVPEKQTQDPVEEVMISIGAYKKHPCAVSKLLAVPNSQKPRVLAWMNYVADEWEPDINNLELLRQKAAIIKELSSITEKMAA